VLAAPTAAPRRHARADQEPAIAENLSEVFWITNADKTKVEYVSPAYETVWGRIVEEIYDRPISFLEAIVPEDREATERRVKQQAEGGYDVEYRIERPDGTTRWIHDRSVAIRDEADCVYRLIGVAEDITERKAAENRLYELAHFEQLTGITNRLYFGEIVDAAIGRNAAGAVILLDLDGFKKVNDSAGHAVGDLLLRAAAKRLTEVAPPNATVSRWGGDEFAVFVPEGSTTGSLAEIIGKVREVCSEPFLLARRKVFLTASIGIAPSPDHGSSAAELMAHADPAMYRAKAERPGTERFFSPEMKQEIQQEMDLEAELRRALPTPSSSCITSRRSTSPPAARSVPRHSCAGGIQKGDFCRRRRFSRSEAEPSGGGGWRLDRRYRVSRCGAAPSRWLSPADRRQPLLGPNEGRRLDRDDREAAPGKRTASRTAEIEITEKIILSQDPATLVTLTRIVNSASAWLSTTMAPAMPH
jgi:diguanylate cyclase (GGDEF)-like protein/PAS domain S-box-containing protein